MDLSGGYSAQPYLWPNVDISSLCVTGIVTKQPTFNYSYRTFSSINIIETLTIAHANNYHNISAVKGHLHLSTCKWVSKYMIYIAPQS